jgi:hypothetical protein
MRARFRNLFTGAVLAALCVAPRASDAFPGFARKHSPEPASLFTYMPCAGCHDQFPKLTPFGRRFKENGFRMDGDPTTWKDAIRAYPFAIRTSSFTTGIGPDGDTSTAGILKPIAAGSLGSTVSFWIEQPFDINSNSNGIKRRDLNYAWVGAFDVARGLKADLLNVRAGSFELDLPFTQVRTHNLFAYDAYFLSGGDADWSLAAPQRGFELSGRPVSWGRYSVAVSDSVRRSDEYQRDYRPDVYARFSADFNVTHRVGAFAYSGRDELEYATGPVAVDHRRVGADFDLRFGSAGATLYGLYLWGADRGFYQEEVSHGGFLQAEKLATSWLLLTARYSQVSAAEEASRELRRSFAVGAHAWFRERFRIGFEYRFQDRSRPDEGVLLIDFVL